MSLAAVITASLKKMAMDPAFEAELLTKDKTKASSVPTLAYQSAISQ